ncbi:hypothetical protein [Stenotrophomonas tumulicola]|uniref:Secreted protein n=1 Tax=Stenotrophomonas tumulicola TaxID=1685415 RepID=A0A7W3II59_9GAMM|nr:hypothetical protein [Stenotrophomonas tumulicola]MBA8681891.1 hypothetical protein [Stenotrophomonas tumulicola]
MKSVLIAGFVVALGISGAAHAKINAKPDKDAPLVQLDVKESVRDQLVRVERALQSEQYSEIGLEEKSKVSAAIDRIRTKLGDHETVEQANPLARTEIYNDQELVNTILSRAHADSRMVCRRERATGSNRPQQVCMTVAQRREAMENSRDVLRNYNRVNPPAGTP